MEQFYPAYLQSPSRRPAWLRVDRLLGEYGIGRDDRRGRNDFQRQMENRQDENPENFSALRRGWCWGGQKFRDRLLALLPEDVGNHHRVEEAVEAEVARAERMIRTALTAAKWREADLVQRRKGDPVKVKLAGELRAETTMGWRWIAERLRMGKWRSAANLIRLAK